MAHVYPPHVEDELQAGDDHSDREPAGTFAQVPEWVALADISPQALALYVRLRMHVNRSREAHEPHKGVVWPGMEALAKMMGYSRRQSLRPHLADLSRIGALEVRRVEGRNGRRNVYVVHFLAHRGHDGPRSLKDFYDEHHAEQDASMGGVAPMGMCGTAHVGRDGEAPMNHTNANHTNRTTRTTPPGEDDCASVGREPVRDLMLIKPDDLSTLRPGPAGQRLIGIYAAALHARGVTVSEEAKDAVAAAIKTAFREGKTHDQVWSGFCSLLDDSWHGKNKHGWIVAPRPTDTGERAA